LDLNIFLSGKINLNEYVHRVIRNGAFFHIHYWGVMPKHYDNLLHKHSFFEVCYVVEGTGEYIDGDSTYTLKENTLFFSKPEVLHQIKSEKGLFLLYVGFELIEAESTEEWIRIMEEAKQCSEAVMHVNDDTVVPLIWKSLLIQAAKTKHACFEDILINLAHSLILSLLQTFTPYSYNDNQENLNESCSRLITLAKLYIKDNLTDSLKLKETAKHLHISGRHLSRMFVSEIGVSYSEYVQNERIQRAAGLLKTTDLTIKDIAEKTGFTSVHYFTRVFTSSLSCSPGRFRSLYTNIKTTQYTAY
jgi:AraC family transcriptional regulator, arabinose operon regulatory protein